MVDVDPAAFFPEAFQSQPVPSVHTEYPLVRLLLRLRPEPVARLKQGTDGLERDVNQVAQREEGAELVAIGNHPSPLRCPALDALQ